MDSRDYNTAIEVIDEASISNPSLKKLSYALNNQFNINTNEGNAGYQSNEDNYYSKLNEYKRPYEFKKPYEYKHPFEFKRTFKHPYEFRRSYEFKRPFKIK